MATLEIELPDAMMAEGRDAGLLTPQALGRLLTEAIRRRRAGDALQSIADRVAAVGTEPMSLEEIDQEVKAARAERRFQSPGGSILASR